MFCSDSKSQPIPILSSITQLFNDLFGVGPSTNKVVLPRGCKLDDFLRTGVCKLQFSGLQTLFPNTEILIRLIARRCGSSSGTLPELYLDCVGSDCASIIQAYNYQYCTQDADCGTSGMCVLFSDYSIGGGVDPIAWLLWGATPMDKCANSDTFAFNLTQLLQILGGTGQVPAGPSPMNGICQPALVNIKNYNTWLSTLYTITSGFISIPSLSPYASLQGEPPIITATSPLPCVVSYTATQMPTITPTVTTEMPLTQTKLTSPMSSSGQTTRAGATTSGDVTRSLASSGVVPTSQASSVARTSVAPDPTNGVSSTPAGTATMNHTCAGSSAASSSESSSNIAMYICIGIGIGCIVTLLVGAIIIKARGRRVPTSKRPIIFMDQIGFENHSADTTNWGVE